MPSTYTTNNGIELPATGEQSGTWGDTVNTNMSIVDRLVTGVGTITLSGTTHTLTTTSGTLSDGMYRVLVFSGSPSGTNTVTISPNTQQKYYIVKNSSGQSVVLTQGSGGNVTVANGDVKIVYANGGGASAAVVDLTADLAMSSVNITGGTIDGSVIGGTSAAAGTFTTATVGAGLVGTPALTTAGDTNTGLYFPAADTIAATTGGTERMRITSGGLVGIGTSSPNSNAVLTNNGNIAIAAPTRNQATSNQVGVWTSDDPADNGRAAITIATVAGGSSSNSYISFTTNNYGVDRAERMRIDNAGNVGIATTSPSSFGKFAVQGASTTRAFYADALAQPVARYDDNSFVSNGLTIRNTGVSGSNQGIGLLFQLGAGGTAVDSGAIQIRSEADYSTAANQDAAMAFFTAANGTNSERVRIDSSGNVGIGTSAPVDLLQVNRGSGSGITSGISLSTAAGGVGDGSYLKWTGAGTTEKIARIDGVQEGTDVGSIRFNTGNGADDFTERVRIESTGRLKVSYASNGVVTALTDGATITPDFNAANNYSLTIGGARTLANPTNLTAGQSGAIVITQDGTGGRTLAFGTYWKFPGGTTPTLTTTASAVDVLVYYVESTTRITATMLNDVK